MGNEFARETAPRHLCSGGSIRSEKAKHKVCNTAIMRAAYRFRLETYVRISEPLTRTTRRAEITLRATALNTIDSAEVVVPGLPSAGTERVAREELIKVLVRDIGRSRIAALEGAVAIPESKEELEHARPGFATLKVDAVLVADYTSNLQGTLKIDVDSEQPAIFAYFEAHSKVGPVDRFCELFRVLESLSGTRKIWKRVGQAWDIPEPVLRQQSGIGESEDETKKRIARSLLDLRDEARHLTSAYGVSPADIERAKDYSDWGRDMELIAAYSLERHPETREKTQSK